MTASRRSLLLYATLWVAAGAAVAVVLIVVLRGLDHGEPGLPPLQRVELVQAAREGGCDLRRADERAPGNPPAAGARAAAPARPGVYDRQPDVAGLVAALRRGVVVIHYRPAGEQRVLGDLRLVYERAPAGTIVTPNATRMPYLVAATSWHRLLGCRTFTPAALDAIRLFRARHIGRAP